MRQTKEKTATLPRCRQWYMPEEHINTTSILSRQRQLWRRPTAAEEYARTRTLGEGAATLLGMLGCIGLMYLTCAIGFWAVFGSWPF